MKAGTAIRAYGSFNATLMKYKPSFDAGPYKQGDSPDEIRKGIADWSMGVVTKDTPMILLEDFVDVPWPSYLYVLTPMGYGYISIQPEDMTPDQGGTVRIPPALNTKRFSYDKRYDGTHLFSAELSDMGSFNKWASMNAMPYELKIMSNKTGRIIVVQLTKTDRDNDGDVQAWTYKSQEDFGNVEVVIFND